MTNDPHGKEAHDREAVGHSGLLGHECPEWDGLYICEDCDEFDDCSCEFVDDDGEPADY